MTDEEINTTYKNLEQLLHSSPLEFYQRATQILDEYSRDLRRIDSSISRSQQAVFGCYTGWRQHLLPKLVQYKETLENKDLRSSLSKSLAISDQKIDSYIAHMTNEETAIVKKSFVVEVSKQSNQYNKKGLWHFLNQDYEANSAHIKAFHTYHIVHTIIKKNNLHVYDSHRRFPIKQWQHMFSQYQIQQIVKKKRIRLQHIDKQLLQLHSQDNYFRPRILALNIQLVTIYAAKQDYEKKLGRLQNSSKDNPWKRMELYQKTTKGIRESLVAAIPGSTSLTDIQQAIAEIDNIIVYIFDLSTSERNFLMTSMKQYRELIRERDRLKSELKIHVTK